MKRYIIRFINNCEEIIAGICLAAMTFITFANVVGRYFFTRPLTWGDEMSLILAGWAIFLGMAAAYKRNRHLGMEFLLNKVDSKIRMIIEQIITIIIFILCLVLAIVAWQLVLKTTKRTQIMRVSYKLIYSSCASGFTFMAIRSAVNVYNSFFNKKKFSHAFCKENYMSEDRKDVEQ